MTDENTDTNNATTTISTVYSVDAVFWIMHINRSKYLTQIVDRTYAYRRLNAIFTIHNLCIYIFASNSLIRNDCYTQLTFNLVFQYGMKWYDNDQLQITINTQLEFARVNALMLQVRCTIDVRLH